MRKRPICHKNTFFSLLLGVLLGWNLAYAQPEKTLTLKDAIFLALRYNNNILSSEFDRIIDKFNLRAAQNAFELQYALNGSANFSRTKSDGILSHSQSYDVSPSVSLNTNTGTNLSLSMTNSSDGAYYNPGVTLEIQQPLLQGLNSNVVLAPLRNAYDQENISRLNLQQTIISQVVNIINQYNSVITDERNLQIQYAALTRAEKNLEETQALIKAGSKPRMDLAQAQLSVAQSQLAITQQKNSLEQAKQQLLLSIGLDPGIAVKVDLTVPVPHFKIPNLQQSIDTALKNDPTYQSDLLQLKIARRNLLVAEDQQLWKLNADIKASWGGASGGAPNNNFTSLVNGRNNNQSAGFTLSVPINDINLQQQLVSAKITLKKQEIQTLFDKRNVITNVTNSIQSLKTDQEAIKQAQESLNLQQINLNNAYLQFKAGQVDSLSVSQQQTALTSAEQSLLQAQIQFLNDITRYDQTLQLTLKKWHIKIRY